MPYQELEPARIIETIDTLGLRIRERFPESGLSRVCGQLLNIAEHAQARAAWIARPILALRVATAGLILILLVGSIAALVAAKLPKDRLELGEFIQIFEAGINDVVLIGAGIFFLITFETRIKRRRSLTAIHELRALAHIIDMHQLTKDPERIMKPSNQTAHSPRPTMTLFELGRYLDYCSEMLSLIGKIAALYVQRFDDDVALASASEVEQLTTGLSQKIWQKIMLLRTFEKDATL